MIAFRKMRAIWVSIGNFILGPSGGHLASNITLPKRETVSVCDEELFRCCNLRFRSSNICSNRIHLIPKWPLVGHDVATWFEVFWVLRFELVQIKQNLTMTKDLHSYMYSSYYYIIKAIQTTLGAIWFVATVWKNEMVLIQTRNGFEPIKM